MPEPVAVVAQGFGWTAAGAWTAAILLAGVLIRQIVPWRKQNIDAEQRLREDLLARVEKLESTLERERARHDAERALDRHRLNNVTQCFDAIILMLEATPERAQEIVTRIKEMRSTQMRAEALEKAAIHAAEIQETGS